MSEKLKELLEKINEDGVKQAEEKSAIIERKAKADAEKIIKSARSESEKLISGAREEIGKMQASSEAALKQASRDLMLSVKEEIKNILNNVIAVETRKAVSGPDIVDILARLMENFAAKNGEVSDIEILLNKDDLAKLKDSLLAKLKDKLKKDGIAFKTSADIKAGFSISFDKGKSFFDFSDEALAQAISGYINPGLRKLLKT